MKEDRRGPEGAKTSECPDEDFLARFSMQELSPDTPEARHIARCPECRRRLDMLNEALRLWEKKHTAPCGAAVLKRVREGFHRKLHESAAGD